MPLPRNLSGEVITVARDISKSLVTFGNSRVLSTDDVLLGRGGGQYKAYEDLLKDGHCKSVVQKRQLAVVAREWTVEPASSSAQDKKAADMVSAQLKALATRVSADALGTGGFDSTCLNFLDATLKGFAVGEIIWGFDGGEIYASEVKPRNQQIFSFGISKETEDYELKLLTLQDMVFGVPLVKDYPRKFIVHTFGSKDGNPLGVGLGQVLWWPVFFKKQGIKFWLQFVDKFASPTAVAKYSKGATEKQKAEILAALDAIATDAGIALPEGVEIMLLEAARSGSIDTYERLCSYMDTEMSKATLGETLSTDVGDRGSYAASKTHNEVRKEIVKADADLLSDTLNRTLVRWITELNLPNAKPPRVWRNFEEAEDLNTRVTRDKTLFDMGFRLKPEAVTEIYGDHYELIEKQEPQQQNNGAVSDAEFLKNSGVQQEAGGQGSGGAEEENTNSADMSETLDFGSIIDRVLKWKGLSIGVEFLPNQVRFPGRRHSKKLRSGYGHIRGYSGNDGEALDCYIYPGLLKDEPEGSDRVFQVTQLSAEDGDFDEHKFMIGYANLKAAKEAYLQEMPIEFFGGIQEVTIESLGQYKRTPISLSTSRSLPIAPSFAEEQKDAPELYAEQLQERTAPAISSWLEEVRSLVQKSESFEEVRDSLFDLFPKLNTADFTEVMAQAMMAAESAGRWEVVSESGVDFAEGQGSRGAEGTRITDPELLLELRDLLEIQYRDGITAIPEAYVYEDDSFDGVFEDAINPKLTKRYRFEAGDRISYKMLNRHETADYEEVEFSEEEWLDFARSKMFGGSQKKKNCKSGNTSCGYSCISGGKTCWADMPEDARKKAKALAAKARQGQKAASLQVAQQKLGSAQAKAATAEKFYGKAANSQAAKELGIKSGDLVTWSTLKSARDDRDKAQAEVDKYTSKRTKKEPKVNLKEPMSAAEATRALSDTEKSELRAALNPPKSGVRSSPGKEQLEVTPERAKQIKDRAKAAGFKDVEKMSDAELRSLVSYTSNGYVGINGAMRGQQENPNSTLAKQQRLVARQANQALEKMPKYEGEVRRDTRLQKTDVERDYKPGNVITFKGMTSTTSDAKAEGSSTYGTSENLSKASFYSDRAKAAGIRTAATGGETVQITYQIKSRSGRDISAISDRPWEKEVLLPHNFKARVSKVEENNGKYTVYMEEV